MPVWKSCTKHNIQTEKDGYKYPMYFECPLCEAEAENDKLRKALVLLADLLHCGGWLNMSGDKIYNLARKVSLEYWDYNKGKEKTIDNMRKAIDYNRLNSTEPSANSKP